MDRKLAVAPAHSLAAMQSELEEAWDALHAATPAGWYVRRPSYHDKQARMAAVRLLPGRAALRAAIRAATRSGPRRAGVVAEMARCRDLIRCGSVLM
jgi:hypothetical protein